MSAAEETRRTHFDVVVIGASAGGLTPLRSLLSGLTPDFSAAVLVVLHRPPSSPSLLAEILTRSGGMAASNAEDGDRLAPGRVLVAPADRNLIVEPEGRVSFRFEETHHLQSAVDPVLESAAAVYGERTIAVILSGTGHDGTRGCRAVRKAGGVVVVQDPETANSAGMPQSVVEEADLVRAPEELADTLVHLVQEGAASRTEAP